MFSRFTTEARTFVVASQEHARRLGDRYIRTEHLLLALATDGGPTADDLAAFGLTSETIEQHRPPSESCRDDDPLMADKDALASLGIDIDEVRAVVEQTFGPGALEHARGQGRRRRSRRRSRRPTQGYIPFTSSAKRTLETSLRESLRLKHSFIAPAHIGLAIADERTGSAHEILAALDVQRDELRIRLEASLERVA